MDAREIFKGSYYYSDLFDSFSGDLKLEDIDPNGRAISEAIFFHLCKMQYAGWRHRVNFKRHRKHSFSDFFQDIIAFYLRVSLPIGFTVDLEKKIGKAQPDITISYRG